MSDWLPDIYEHLSYRGYLKASYEAGKAHVKAFSFRYLARRAGFTSPSFIKLVMEGERNLSDRGVEQVAQAFGIKGDALEFFRALVAFDQASDAQAKNEAFEQIAASRRFRHARRLDVEMFEYLSRWYYPAIREMTARHDFREDAEWIARELYPPVKAAEVSRALEVLLGLGLVAHDEGGRLQRSQTSVTTGHEVGSLAVGNFHRQMMTRAAASIEAFPSKDRDISALTVCIKREALPELKARIHAFREVLLHLCDAQQSPELVYQINLQMFPLNRTGGEE